MIGAADVGRLFVDPDGDVWRLVFYEPQPTVQFQRVRDGAPRTLALDDPDLESLKPATSGRRPVQAEASGTSEGS